MSALTKIAARFAAPAEPLGINNLVIVGATAIEVGRDLSRVLGDGFQYMDIFALLKDFPLIEQISKIAPQAFAELKDLTAAESKELASAIAEKAGLPNDSSVLGKVKTALSLLARTYQVANDAKVVFHDWSNLFAAQPELA
jgi:hypothetical protein